MRVLHVGKYFPPFAGGMENFLYDLLHGLQKKGVDTAALVHDHVPFRRETRDQTPLAVPVYRAAVYGRFLYAPLSPGFPLLMRRVLRQFKPDLLYLHLPNTSAFWVLVSGMAQRIPWIIHWHSDVVSSTIDARMAMAYRLYRPFETMLLRRARMIIATSPPYLAASRALAPYRSKTRVIPLGLDEARYRLPDNRYRQWAEKTWGPGKRLRILTIGRLTYYKGHEVLVDAVRDTAGVTALIIGDGERKKCLQDRIARYGIGDKIRLSGFLSAAELNALLASCDCLCLPSIERTEAFGLVLLEAMRFGKPVIASRVPGSGIGWVVEHNQTGELVPPGDSAALSAAITRMAGRATCRTWGRAARVSFEQRFRMAAVTRQILAACRACLPG